MADAITAITTALAPANLWSEFAGIATFIGSIGVFAFGYGLVRRVTKGASKGKLRM